MIYFGLANGNRTTEQVNLILSILKVSEKQKIVICAKTEACE